MRAILNSTPFDPKLKPVIINNYHLNFNVNPSEVQNLKIRELSAIAQMEVSQERERIIIDSDEDSKITSEMQNARIAQNVKISENARISQDVESISAAAQVDPEEKKSNVIRVERLSDDMEQINREFRESIRNTSEDEEILELEAALDIEDEDINQQTVDELMRRVSMSLRPGIEKPTKKADISSKSGEFESYEFDPDNFSSYLNSDNSSSAVGSSSAFVERKMVETKPKNNVLNSGFNSGNLYSNDSSRFSSKFLVLVICLIYIYL